MFSDSLRLRLEALNRQSLPETAASVGLLAALGVLPPAVPIFEVPRAAASPAPVQDHSCDLFDLAYQCTNEHGSHFRLRRPLCEFWPGGAERVLRPMPGAFDETLHHELGSCLAHYPQDLLFLDLETCGFSGSMVFLVGLLWHCEGKLVLDQLLARNYAEEQAMLATLLDVAREKTMLVTFNGKSFDWPMVCDRSTRHRLKGLKRGLPAGIPAGRDGSDAAIAEHSLAHCDLLHHARRRWKGLLPNCRLQTLERYVCGRHRSGDIPGSEIPLAYHQFVRTGDGRAMRAVLHHNALDLVTLLEVLLVLGEG